MSHTITTTEDKAKQIADHERYDRQIRVWGAEAQHRLQNSRVLICGLQNLNIEVVKNLVLAGVNITLQDDSDIVDADYTSNFFLTEHAPGKKVVEVALPNIRALNNHVKIDYTTEPLDHLTNDFFLQFNVISAAGATESQALRIDELCRNNSLQKKIIFFWNDCIGDNSTFFADFGENFEYKEDPKTSNVANGSEPEKKPTVTIQSISFPSLQTVLSKSWKDIPSRFFPLSKIFVQFRLFHQFREIHHRVPTLSDLNELKNLYQQLSERNGVTSSTILDNISLFRDGILSSDVDYFPICQDLHPQRTFGLITSVSVLGSVLTQEIIKAISLTGIPGFNVFIFEGNHYSVKAIPIQ